MTNTFLFSLHIDKERSSFQYPFNTVEAYNTSHYEFPSYLLFCKKLFIASVKHPIWSKLFKYERMFILGYLFIFIQTFILLTYIKHVKIWKTFCQCSLVLFWLVKLFFPFFLYFFFVVHFSDFILLVAFNFYCF